MKLIDWLRQSDINAQEASQIFGVSIHAVRKWIRGERTPRPRTQAKIRKVTKGAVNGEDWIPSIASGE